uniref:Uncharacterized protein n=1 Tax=Vitis vinifera TaxID=29760 RepID=A5C186_VITVI|nr:hypothetical protein VITISV_012408 [Vitis vinifera]
MGPSISKLGLGLQLKLKTKAFIGKPKTYLHHKIGPSASTQAQARASSSSQLVPPAPGFSVFATSPRRQRRRHHVGTVARERKLTRVPFPAHPRATSSPQLQGRQQQRKHHQQLERR